MSTLPTNEKAMWRRLVARAHPDAGGDHELFIWASALREHVCAAQPSPYRVYAPPPPPRPQGEPQEPQGGPQGGTERNRVPFNWEAGIDFDALTRRAMALALDRR